MRTRPGRLGNLLDELFEVDGCESASAGRGFRLGVRRVADLGKLEGVVEDLERSSAPCDQYDGMGLTSRNEAIQTSATSKSGFSFLSVAGADTSRINSIWDPMPCSGVRSSWEI